MADIQHSVIADPHIHEPKGISAASIDTVYVSNGAGSGAWIKVDSGAIDMADLVTELQADLDDGTLDINGTYFLTARLADVSAPSSIIIPLIDSCTVVGATAVLGGPITVANSVVTFQNAAGASMGTPVTVLFTGSAKGNQYNFTSTGNNVIVGPSWIEVLTDGGSTDTQPLYITVELAGVLNP